MALIQKRDTKRGKEKRVFKKERKICLNDPERTLKIKQKEGEVHGRERESFERMKNMKATGGRREKASYFYKKDLFCL